MWGAPPRPAARSMKFLSLLFPVTPNIAGTACIKACLSLFPRRVSAPLHPLDGRKTAIPPAEQARSAMRRRCGMQFASRTRTARPRARAGRAARRRCADPCALRRRAAAMWERRPPPLRCIRGVRSCRPYGAGITSEKSTTAVPRSASLHNKTRRGSVYFLLMTSWPSFTSTSMVSPSMKRPSRIAFAARVSTFFWMYLLSGLAPNCGS